MTTRPTIVPVTGPRVWRGPELARRGDWIRPVPADALAELDAVARAVRGIGHGYEALDPDAAELPALRALAREVRAALGEGLGFTLLRGVPVARYALDELKAMLFALGRHIGRVGGHGPGGARIAEVMDVAAPGAKEFYFHRGGALPMHMDPVDVVGLLAVRKAKHGGHSGIVSAMAVHNEILRTRPDLLALLYRGFRHRRRELRRGDAAPLTEHFCPVFADIGGETICSYLPQPIVMAIEEGLTTLSAAEQEALDYLDETAARPDLALTMDLEPGDIQLLNNRCILHNRGDYADYPERARRRLLLRVWLTVPGWRKYPATIPHADYELHTAPA